jgi:hypothetical protein
VRQTDANGHLQMLGSRTMVSPLDRKRWYYANRPSPSVPDDLGDEKAIRAIWQLNPLIVDRSADLFGCNSPGPVAGRNVNQGE